MQVRYLPTPPRRLLSRVFSLILCLGFAIQTLGGTAVADNPPSNKAQPATAETVTAPRSSGIDNMPRLGIESLYPNDPAELSVAGDSGAGYVRVQLNWGSLQRTAGAAYRWNVYDSRIKALADKGLGILLVVQGCPEWACPHFGGPIYDDRYDDFGQFVAAVAQRYSHAPYNAHYWEFWNEPDDGGDETGSIRWGRNPDKYVRMLSMAYPAIKAEDPESVVMNGGLAFDNWFSQNGPFNPDFLPGVLDHGGANYLDAVAFHFYRNNGHGWTHIGVKTQAVRNVLASRGIDLPIVSTEAGLTSSPDFGGSEAEQARYVVTLNVHAAASGLRSNVWFLAKDFVPDSPGWRVFSESGLIRLNNSHKPSYFAMRTLATEIGSGIYQGQMSAANGLSGSLEGYYFRSADNLHKVAVVWNSNSLGVDTLTISAFDAVDLARVVNLYGSPVPTTPGPDGTVLVSVGADPVYVVLSRRFEDVPHDMWAYEYIEYLAERGIISGYGDGTFRPGNNATRGQFSKMVVLGQGWDLLNPSVARFRDVPRGSPFYEYIETAAERGILGGYPCDPAAGASEPCPGVYFRPGNNISRGQIAKLVVLSKGWDLLNPAIATFNDVPVGSTFYTVIETAVSKGVITGYGCNTAPGEPCPGAYFRPSHDATRAQLSKMLAIALQQP